MLAPALRRCIVSLRFSTQNLLSRDKSKRLEVIYGFMERDGE